MKKNPTLKINYKLILYILLLFPYITPRTFEDYPPMVSKIWNILILINTLIIILYLIIHKKIEFPKNILTIIIFCITYLLITIIKNIVLLKSCFSIVYLLILSLFLNEEIKHDKDNVLKALVIIYMFWTILNNILIVLFPNGIFVTNSYHSGHLLGDDNAIIYMALPAIIVLIIYSYIKHNRISLFAWLNIVFCEFIFLKLWSTSAFLAFGVFALLLFFCTKKIKFSPRKILLMSLSFGIMIFFFNKIPIIKDFVTNYLHKDITFTGRTYIWDAAFQMINKHPLLGYGGYFVMGQFKTIYGIYPVHTTHLQILIDGGVILFIEYISIYIMSFHSLMKNKKYIISTIVSYGILAMIISYTFEYAYLNHFIIIMTLALNMKYIISSIESEEQVRND